MAYTIERWIDEMNLLKPDKVKRIKTAHEIENALAEFFVRQLKDIVEGIFLFGISSESYRDEITDIYMMYSGTEDEWMRGRARRFANEVQNTTEKSARVSTEPEYISNILFGIPLRNAKSVPQNVRDLLSRDRAARIAMNETNVIHNYLHHMKLREAQITHTWDATLDEFTRPHHFEADGLTVPIDEPFVIAGERMMFPGDDSLGATAKNLINCRCIEL